MRKTTGWMSLLLAGLLAGCGGGGGDNSKLLLPQHIAVQGVGASTNFSFDISAVLGNRYYVTDRTNAAVDVFDTKTGAQVAQIKGTGALAFAGQGASNGVSGPDGINPVGNLLYVGDVNSVKIVDPATNTVVKSITVGNEGVRADEGCVDPSHNLYFIATPEAATPYVSVINTQTQTLVGTITFTDPAGNPSAGLEQCQYDTASDTYYVNNDGTTANPHGELMKIPGASIRGITPGGTANYTALAGAAGYAEGNCDPTGLALGPNKDIAVNCREATAGAPLELLIMDRTNGAVLANLNAGGGDQLWYAPERNRYYNAASRWTASGKSSGGNCTTASPCVPRLISIDAGSRTIAGMADTGNNAHSVASDPVTSNIFVPISSDTAPAGCATCRNGSGGLLMFTPPLNAL
jgi:YVTN family beta-propeller protein